MGLLDPILFSQISTLLDPARLTAHYYRGDVQVKLLVRDRPKVSDLFDIHKYQNCRTKLRLAFSFVRTMPRDVFIVPSLFY
jgi:hypothetical protein